LKQRLNSLLFTSDLDVLVLTLHLLLRPSQQYSAQPAVTSALNISTPRLRSLAKRWPNLREYGVGLVDLASINGRPEVEALPSEAREVNYSFYRTDSNEKEKKDETEMHGTDVPEALLSTPRKSSTAPPAAVNNAAVNVHIDQQSLESKEVMSLLADTVGRYSVPEDEKFELLCRIRSAAVLMKGKEAEREKLVIIRLLSIAIFGHTHIEAQAMSSLFLYEPDLIAHIAELLQLDRGVSMAVQTAAIAALDALARYRNKIQEVLTAINAGVNHGILMALVRKTIADVGSPDCKLPHSFVEALLSFVTYIASHSAGGNMVVGAGLVPLLVQIISNKIPERLAIVSKTMQLVDNVLYSFTNAFQLFCGGHGVEALVDRIEVSY
jgi:E3 ubiquitin-protein ligase HUWE1